MNEWITNLKKRAPSPFQWRGGLQYERQWIRIYKMEKPKSWIETEKKVFRSKKDILLSPNERITGGGGVCYCFSPKREEIIGTTTTNRKSTQQ